jgi:hypothetical protein
MEDGDKGAILPHLTLALGGEVMDEKVVWVGG